MTYADKIAKLIAKADDTSHPEEAETFMRKAQQLMHDHGISLLEIGRMSDDPLDYEHGTISTPRSFGWFPHLVAALATLYGCEALWRKGYDEETGRKVFKYDLVGRESARITTKLMIPFIKRQVLKLGRESYKRGDYKSTTTSTARIGNALTYLVRHMHSEKSLPQGSGVNALVPVDLIEDLINSNNEKVTRKSNKGMVESHAIALAEQVSVDVPVAADSKAKRITK